MAGGVPFSAAITVLLSVLPLAPYLPRCGKTRRSSYSFTKPFIFLARHETAERELWNEPSQLQWVESGTDRRQREKRESGFSVQPSAGVLSVARSDTLLGQSGRKYRTRQACALAGVPAGSQMCWEAQQLQLTWGPSTAPLLRPDDTEETSKPQHKSSVHWELPSRISPVPNLQFQAVWAGLAHQPGIGTSRNTNVEPPGARVTVPLHIHSHHHLRP